MSFLMTFLTLVIVSFVSVVAITYVAVWAGLLPGVEVRLFRERIGSTISTYAFGPLAKCGPTIMSGTLIIAGAHLPRGAEDIVASSPSEHTITIRSTSGEEPAVSIALAQTYLVRARTLTEPHEAAL